MDFKDMTVVITGAARGMGKAFAEAFAGNGAKVALCDLNLEQLEDAAEQIKNKDNGGVLSARVDVSLETEVNNFVRDIEEELGYVDILVNNAAIHPLRSVTEITGEEWDRVMAVNIKGYFNMVKAVLPGMRNQKFGRIINIASEAAKNGGTICSLHYAATKGAVLSFTRNLAKQVGKDGITVNAIAPGRIATDMANSVSAEENQVYIDMSVVKKLGKAEDIAHGVLFLASRRSGFITGETLNINGGTYMD